MAFAETAQLTAELNLRGDFVKGMQAAQKASATFGTKFAGVADRAKLAGRQIGTGIANGVKIAAVAIAALATQVAAGLGTLVKLESITAQTNAVIKSTAGVAGVTGRQIRALAEKYEGLNAVMDDKVIQSGANVLLTFTKINKEAFEPALASALDLSTALGTDLQGSIIQIGKALNDPIKGITALRRVGVSFTADQEKLIKALIQEGKLFEAQKVILGELKTEFGGSFAAQGKTTEGVVAGIGDAVEDLQVAIASGLLPVVKKVLPQFRAFLTSPAFIQGATDLGNAIAGIFTDANIRQGVDILKAGFQAAKDAAPVLVEAAKTVGQVVGTAVDIFKSLPPEIQGLAVAGLAINKLTGGLVTNIAGGLIGAVLKQLVSGVVNVAGGIVNVNGVPGGVPGGKIPPVAGVTVPLIGAAVAFEMQPIFDQQREAFERLVLSRRSGISEIDARGDRFIQQSATQSEQQREELVRIRQIEQTGLEKIAQAIGELPPSLAEANAAFTAEEKILGKVRKSDPKSFAFHIPQRRFLEQNTNKDTLTIAKTFVDRFQFGSSKFDRSQRNQTNALEALKGLQQRFLAKGDTASAAKIGSEIDQLQTVLDATIARKLDATNRKLGVVSSKIADQKFSITSVINSSVRLNGREVEAASNRYKTTTGFRPGGHDVL